VTGEGLGELVGVGVEEPVGAGVEEPVCDVTTGALTPMNPISTKKRISEVVGRCFIGASISED